MARSQTCQGLHVPAGAALRSVLSGAWGAASAHHLSPEPTPPLPSRTLAPIMFAASRSSGRRHLADTHTAAGSFTCCVCCIVCRKRHTLALTKPWSLAGSAPAEPTAAALPALMRAALSATCDRQCRIAASSSPSGSPVLAHAGSQSAALAPAGRGAQPGSIPSRFRYQTSSQAMPG